jgi:hydroxyacylglutathione hydrolase
MTTAKANLIRVPALQDNYIWMLHNPSSNAVAVIDPAEAEDVFKALDDNGLTPTEVVNTHHHWDHTGGNAAVMEKYDIPLKAPYSEKNPIENISTVVKDGDEITIAEYKAGVIGTPGHTLSHVAFYLPDCFGDHGAVFVGDNLFSLGCGRVFEGTMEDMWSSLLAIRALPDETIVCGGHEYSAGNADYTESLNWDCPEAASRIAEIRAMRKKGEATLPVRLGDEKKANPFLNCDNATLTAAMGMDGADANAVFTALREGKDNF